MIASLFTSSVVFVAIIFYFIYSERISLIILLGMFITCASVPCVAITDDEVNQELDFSYLWVSILFALSAGFMFALSALVSKHYIEQVGFSPL